MAAGEGPEEAIREAQSVLTSSTPELIVDGRWGSYTNAAYERAPAEDRVLVDSILAGNGLDANALARANRSAKAAKDQTYLLRKAQARMERSRNVSPEVLEKVEAAIRAASSKTGVDVGVLRGFVKIESGFNPNAVNGSSRGLMQIQPAAWADSQAVDGSIGPYSNVFDPEKNALAGALYLKINESRLRRSGYTGQMTPAVLYLAHQQGSAGFVELWKASRGVPTTTNYVTPVKMKRNAPQDGQGVTLNKGEFFRRWMAVAERKIAQ